MGGGLAGYRRLRWLRKAGRSVIFFEQAGDVGGRAATQVRREYFFQSRAARFVLPGSGFPAVAGARRALHGTLPRPGKEPASSIEQPKSPCPVASFLWCGSRLFERSRKRAIDSAPDDALPGSMPGSLTALRYLIGSETTLGAGNCGDVPCWLCSG